MPTVKIIVAGHKKSGKTALVRRFCEGKYFSELDSTKAEGTNLFYKRFNLDEQDIEMQISVVAKIASRQSRQGSATLYRDNDVAIVTLDPENRKSFLEAKQWVSAFAAQDVPVILVGTRWDNAKKIITEEEFNKFYQALREETSGLIDRFVTSAQRDWYVDALFRRIARFKLDKCSSEQSIVIKPPHSMNEKYILSNEVRPVSTFFERHMAAVLFVSIFSPLLIAGAMLLLVFMPPVMLAGLGVGALIGIGAGVGIAASLVFSGIVAIVEAIRTKMNARFAYHRLEQELTEFKRSNTPIMDEDDDILSGLPVVKPSPLSSGSAVKPESTYSSSTVSHKLNI